MSNDDSERPFDLQTALLLRAVAHDFNNLLSSTLGHAELLGLQAKDDAVLSKRSRAIQRAALKGVEITRKLAGAGRELDLHLETLEALPLLEEECRRFQSTLRDGVDMRLQLAAVAGWKVDRRGLQQIMSALLSNARTWCPSPGWIQVSVRPCDEGIELGVEDSGPGFPSELSDEELFAPFVGRGREGSGLGLWLVQRLMTAHGGSVILRRGPGAQVRCIFPTD